MRVITSKQDYTVDAACKVLNISRAGYYRWLSGKTSPRIQENKRIAKLVKEIHTESPDKGYRRIRDDLERYYNTPVSDKRALRICRSLCIRPTIKYSNQGCTKSASQPEHIAENVLNRIFKADKPNEKWVTDVTEFKYYIGVEVHKVYLSAILDLCDRRIISAVISDYNDSALVHRTLKGNATMAEKIW